MDRLSANCDAPFAPVYFCPMAEFRPRTYWEDRLANATGLQGVGYLGLGQDFNAWMYRVRRSVFLEVVQRHVPDIPGKAVLDVGSGTGFYLDRWAELHATDVVGSDITQVATDRLSAEYPGVPIHRMDISDPSLPISGPFDVISCMDVLFHVVLEGGLEQAFTNFKNLLRPGGYLVFSDNLPHTEALKSAHFKSRGFNVYMQILKQNGFEVIARKPMFHLLNTPVDSDSRLLHRWWTFVLRMGRRSHRAAGWIARVVYPLECRLVQLRKEGASTEILICQAR